MGIDEILYPKICSRWIFPTALKSYGKKNLYNK